MLDPARNDGSMFVGREQELNALTSHLLTPSKTDTPGVFIYGPMGVGKTALIQEFVRRHGRAFPAGIQYSPTWSARPGAPEELMEDAAMLANALRPRDHGLVVLEDVERSSPSRVSMVVRKVRERRPGTRFILTGRHRFLASGNWLDVEIGGLAESDIAALLRGQVDLGDDDLLSLVSRMQGSPLLASAIAQMATRGEGLGELLGRLEPATYSGLLGPDGRPLAPYSQPDGLVEVRFQAVNADLLARIGARPELMHELTPRQFEEFVAELYERHGFKVELTPASRDGGVDLYAVRYDAFGSYLTVVDCKRYAPHRPVQVKLVRELYGAVQDKGASVGVLATTSSFTAGAKKLQERHRYRLALQDWFDLQDMLCRAPE
jgi:restriction system protein